jgi:hypothetical protein
VDEDELFSSAQTIPFALPFADIDGVGAGKPNCSGDKEVGVVEIRPELLALKEKALR